MIRHTPALAVAALMLAAPWAVQPAAAEPPTQAAALCAGSPRGCALQTNDWLREGATFPVTVIGNASARVQVVVYLAVATDGALAELRPISVNTEVITNSQGVAHTEVAIPTLGTEGDSSGWALVSVGGLQHTLDTQRSVGQFVPFGSRVPRILGDGYGREKPVGATLELQFTGAIPGTRFAVEYADDDGIWQDVTSDQTPAAGPPAGAQRPDDVSTVAYTVPRGLTSNDRVFRLRNVSDSAISPSWLATPGVDGVLEAPARPIRPPAVGADLSGANVTATHPEQTVILAAGGIACIAVVLTLAGASTGLRRRGGLR